MMTQVRIHQSLMKTFALITLCIMAFGFTSRYGLDSFAIFLNDKLILKQTVNQPLDLRVLQLDKVKDSDRFHFSYTHCQKKDGAGTDRSISLVDKNGALIKKWTFANAKGSDSRMTIPAKELISLKKMHASKELSLRYVADELPEGEMLSMLRL
ncbi:hypothetical protein GZH53_09910 [Flavihumibacter sp. R14]|nr:hypothetical protein [Flavihumibacter soli]